MTFNNICSSQIESEKLRFWKEGEYMKSSRGSSYGKLRCSEPKKQDDVWHKCFRSKLRFDKRRKKYESVQYIYEISANFTDVLKIEKRGRPLAESVSDWQKVILQNRGDNKVDRLANLAPAKIPAACLNSGEEEHRAPGY